MTLPSNMTFSNDHDIHHIAAGVISCTLPKPEWTHAAHIAAAVWIIKDRGLSQAEADMPALIKAYNRATGVENNDTDGYHETITLASLRAVAGHMREIAKGTSLVEMVNAILTSDLGKPDWLLRYWSQERLFSVAARRTWVAPDLRAFA